MIRKFYFAIFFIAIIVHTIQAQERIEQKPSFLAVAPKDFPPQYSIDEEGKPIGFAIEVMNHIALISNIEIRYILADTWTQADEMLRSGQADLIPNLGITASREEYFSFTSPVEIFSISILVRRQDKNIKSIDDLSGHKVAAVKYNVGVSLLENLSDVDLIIFNTPSEALFDLLARNVDALVYPQPVLLKVARQIDVEDRVKIVGEPLLIVKRAIAVRKDNELLLTKLNAAVEKFVGSHEYREIYVRWYGQPKPFWSSPNAAIFMAILVLCVFIAMGVWRYHSLTKMNNKLNKTVAQLEQAEKALMISEGQLRQQLLWINVLNSITRSIAQRNSIDSILRVVLIHLENNLPISFGGITLCKEDKKKDGIFIVSTTSQDQATHLGFVEGATLPEDETGFLNRLPPNEASVFSLTELLAEETTKERMRLFSEFQREGVRSMILVPLGGESGRVGTIFLLSRDTLSLNEYQMGFFQGLSESLVLAVYNRKLYQNLEQSYQELQETQKSLLEQERLNAMGQMASGIAHDINNTLAPITLYTEALLESEAQLSDRTRRFLKTIQEATKDIENTTMRLRKFYRKPEVEEERQVIELQEMMAQVIELTRPRWQDIPQKKGAVVQIKTEIIENTPPLIGIESETREAIMNLIFNSVDAMPDGGTITLRAYSNDSYCILEVADTGTGMDEKAREKCLEPFYTTKGESGTGLGLATVYGTIKRHRGEIEIESEPGKGTVVRLFFPSLEPPPERTYAAQADSISSLKILCIDDDTLVRDALKETLELAGHQAEVAESGMEGLKLFQEHSEQGEPFNLVITDLGMPHMDGWQVAQRIKEKAHHTPVILLSGWGNFVNLNGDIPEFVDRVLGKPPKMEEIRGVIQELFRQSGDVEKK